MAARSPWIRSRSSFCWGLRDSEFVNGQFCPASAVEQLIFRWNSLPALYVGQPHSVEAAIARVVEQSESSNAGFARPCLLEFCCSRVLSRAKRHAFLAHLAPAALFGLRNMLAPRPLRACWNHHSLQLDSTHISLGNSPPFLTLLPFLR